MVNHYGERLLARRSGAAPLAPLHVIDLHRLHDLEAIGGHSIVAACCGIGVLLLAAAG